MASITLDIKSELPKAIRWTDQMTKQLPFAISKALNSVGFDARVALKGASNKYFDRPTPFIQNAWRVQKSTKRNLEVVVYPDDKRKPYLLRNITGGQRGLKPFEAKLGSLSVGNLPSNSRLIPVPGNVKLNSYGNVSKAALNRIAKQVETKGRNSVFIGKPTGSRPAGVYQRKPNGSLRALFIAQPSATYRAIFPIGEIGTKIAERRFGNYLRSSLEQALATAR